MFRSGSAAEHQTPNTAFSPMELPRHDGRTERQLYAPGASRVVGAGARLADGMNDGAEFFDFYACEWRGHDFGHARRVYPALRRGMTSGRYADDLSVRSRVGGTRKEPGGR